MPLPRENFKVFISHATIDSALVSWIAEGLDRLHIRSFVYENYQIGGQNRFEKIKSFITACPYFLVLLTRDGIASQWVNQEIGYAVGMGKNIIPIIEVDELTGIRIKSKGFVELHDPINYYKNDHIRLMSSILYTFWSLLQGERKWQDLIFLSCNCGKEFDGKLDIDKNWHIWLESPHGSPFPIPWICPDCSREVNLSFPDCHLLPQQDTP